jgi:diguanylate cyclase (GGDEF)-like protein
VKFAVARLMLITLCLLLSHTTQAARNIAFQHLTTQDGLSHSGITDIVQDKFGFMWISTQEGLNRYDGYEVVSYEHDYREARSLSDDWVWSLCIDDNNNVWVGTNNGGLDYFDRATNSFYNWQHDPQDPASLSSNDVRVVFLDSRKRLWVGTRGGGLNLKRKDGLGFDKYPLNDRQGAAVTDSITEIFEDDAGRIWIGTDNGLALIDPVSKHLTLYQHDAANPNSLSDSHVRVIVSHRDELWVGTQNGGLNRFNPATGVFHRYPVDVGNSAALQSGLVRDILVDHNGTVWVGTDKGLSEWRSKQDDFITYEHDAEDAGSLSGNRVENLYEDASGVLWVGTYEGISRWNYLSDAFTYYTHKDGQLSNDIVVSLAQAPSGTLWVGTYGTGINRLEPTAKDGFVRRQFDLQLPDQRIMALWAEDDDNLWFGTRTGGLCHLQLTSMDKVCLVHDDADVNSLSANGVTSILGEDDSIWVGTYGGGLNRIDRSTGRVSHFRHDDNDDRSLGSDRVLAIYRDSQGFLWVGAEGGGLNLFREKDKTFERYQSSDNDSYSISNDTAWEIFESRDGTLWVGTLNGGVNAWTLADRLAGKVRFQHFDRVTGLQSNTIYGILEDEKGFIWLSGNRGLAQLNPQTLDVVVYDQRTGTRGNEFNFGARLKGLDGQLLFGGAAGLLSFEPAAIQTNKNVPAVVINGVSSLNETVFAHSDQNQPSSIRLGYTERMITFEFAALDYASPDKNLYEYQLVGFDEGWLKAEGFRRATYTSLPAGNYTFRVKAANNDQVWNVKGAAIDLLVVPPPWLSWWAYLGYALLLFGSIASYLLLQRRKLVVARQQHLILEGLVRQRTSELAEQNGKLETVNEQLRKASMSDALTGLHNRRYLYDYMENQVAIMQRSMAGLEEGEVAHESIAQGSTVFFMMIDLDGFKSINDSFGHPAGDQALIQVCDILLKHTRDSDTLIRWGGDEFLIVGRGHGLQGPNQLAERIRRGLLEHTFVVANGAKGLMTGSIGFAPYPFNSWHPSRFNWEQVLAIADQAAYVAKTNGKNAWLGVEGTADFSCADYNIIGDKLQTLVEQERVQVLTSITRPVQY